MQPYNEKTMSTYTEDTSNVAAQSQGANNTDLFEVVKKEYP